MLEDIKIRLADDMEFQLRAERDSHTVLSRFALSTHVAIFVLSRIQSNSMLASQPYPKKNSLPIPYLAHTIAQPHRIRKPNPTSNQIMCQTQLHKTSINDLAHHASLQRLDSKRILWRHVRSIHLRCCLLVTRSSENSENLANSCTFPSSVQLHSRSRTCPAAHMAFSVGVAPLSRHVAITKYLTYGVVRKTFSEREYLRCRFRHGFGDGASAPGWTRSSA
ncbi:hypothetical protein K402DRAFT_104546 [Aulographum hederae CBS 113979]|uniref:Uncharacterized protein n=1 Tax=Aulographum hederae CBS 113979 TaxID=1176131 RepID=A0A6G1GXP1_9PEZI|nr:hypothetical protein K402DRAFT_104546 [Aulographum hederae CBS 113979]